MRSIDTEQFRTNPRHHLGFGLINDVFEYMCIQIHVVGSGLIFCSIFRGSYLVDLQFLGSPLSLSYFTSFLLLGYSRIEVYI